jgi:hypothetical protein
MSIRKIIIFWKKNEEITLSVFRTCRETIFTSSNFQIYKFPNHLLRHPATYWMWLIYKHYCRRLPPLPRRGRGMFSVGNVLLTCYLLFNQSLSISFNLFQHSLRVSDCSGKPAKAEAAGAQEWQSDRRKLLSTTMSPTANDCGLVAESATAKPERPNKKTKT